jgi:protocatechuate 3,4-dioxygenase beta subunit
MWSFLFFFVLHANIFESSYHRYYCNGQLQVEEVEFRECVWPSDNDGLLLTPEDMLGPFYEPNSISSDRIGPEELLSDPAQRLHVAGTVFRRRNDSCVSGVPNVVVELWYAGPPDANGNYYRTDEYRGQVVTDSDGRYNFTQTFPALYPTRPMLHNHFRLSTLEGEELLVTQMYFLGNTTGFVSEVDEARTLQVVDLQRTAEGARSVEFNVYVEYAEEVVNRPPTGIGMDNASSTTSGAASNYHPYYRFTSRDYYVWSQGSMTLILAIIVSSLFT